MLTIAIYAVVVAAGFYLGKKYGSYVSLSAVEAELTKAEATATADVKALIAKVRAIF
jgi:hypothetical protein